MQAELEHLHRALDNPERPLMAVVGGAKISTKLDLLKQFDLRRSMCSLSAGPWRTRFLAAQGYQVGRSLAELDLRETAKQIISDKVMLPTDVVVAETLQPNAHHRITGINDVTPHEMILDVGPRTIRAFSRVCRQ